MLQSHRRDAVTAMLRFRTLQVSEGMQSLPTYWLICIYLQVWIRSKQIKTMKMHQFSKKVAFSE